MRDERENNATHESLRMICPCHVRLPPRWLLNAKAPTRTGDCSFALYCDSLDIHLIFNNQLCEGQSLFESRKAMERGKKERGHIKGHCINDYSEYFCSPIKKSTLAASV